MKTFGDFIAKLLSFVLHPIFIPTYSCLLYQNLFGVYPSNQCFWEILGIYFLITAIIPILFVVMLYHFKLVGSIYLNDAKERQLPYLINLLSYIALCTILNWLKLPILLVLHIGCICLLLLIGINMISKVSAHMTAIGGLIATLLFENFYSRNNPYVLFMALFFLAGLLAFARLRLKSHTATQVLIGFMIGFLVPFLIIILL